MRIVFALLVVANLAFFGYLWAGSSPAQREPAAMERQIEPEKIHLLTPEEAQAKIRAANRLCIEWGAFLAADASRAQGDLAEIAQGAKITQRSVEEPSAWWVYLPPLPTRPAANRRVAELKRLGFADTALMPDDSKTPLAISLGVFSSEAAAIRHQAALAKKNVKGVQILPRDGVPKIYLQLRGAPDGARARMMEMKVGYPGSEVQDCPREVKPGDAKASDAARSGDATKDSNKSGDATGKPADTKAAGGAKAGETKAGAAKGSGGDVAKAAAPRTVVTKAAKRGDAKVGEAEKGH